MSQGDGTSRAIRPRIAARTHPTLLETLLHLEIDGEDRSETFQVLKIEASEEVSFEQVDIEKHGAE
jgi:hypothetical protein